MTRRELLLAIGAQLSACGANQRGGQATERSYGDRADGADGADEGGNEYSPIVPLVRHSPVVFAGGRLARATGTAVDLHDPQTLAKTASFDIAAVVICGLDADRLAALVNPAPGDITAHLHVLDPASGAVERYAGALANDARSVVAAGPRAVMIAGSTWVTRYQLDGGALVRHARLRLPSRAEPARRRPGDQLIAVGDRLVYPVYSGLAVFEADRQTLTCRTDEPVPLHVAPASSDRVWYSSASSAALVLVGLESRARVDQSIDLGPGVVTHLASSGGLAVAVVGVDARAPRYDVAAVDESGQILWRDTLVDDLSGPQRSPAVAVGGDRVVAIAGDSGLAAWEARSGKRLTV